LVTGDVGIKAYVQSTNSGSGSNGGSASELATDLIAYYATTASISGITAGDCVGWSASYSSEVNFVKTMTAASGTGTIIAPSYILYGNM
jgi:hypothetical protein